MTMNLKETIISSSFFHLILFFLMAAVSNYTSGSSGSFQNIISVDLMMDRSTYLPAARNDYTDIPPLVSRDEARVSDQSADDQPEEAATIPEPEKKTEPVAEPANSENAEKASGQSGGFSSLEAYREFIRLHTRVFGQRAGARVNDLVGEALKVNKRIFYGGAAVVSLEFGLDGIVKEVLVESESPDLKAFLEEIGWIGVPAPSVYSLGLSRVKIEFTVLQGYLSFKITAL